MKKLLFSLLLLQTSLLIGQEMTCPADVTVNNCLLPDSTGVPTFSDLSAVDTFYYYDYNDDPCVNLVERSWVMVDTLGNRDTCSQALTVNANYLDFVLPPDITNQRPIHLINHKS